METGKYSLNQSIWYLPQETGALAFLLGMEWMNFKEPYIIPTFIKMPRNSEANALLL
jgi:hypothetical protein